MTKLINRIFDNRFVVLLSLLLAGSILVGLLNDRNKKEIIRVLDNRISEIINFSIEGGVSSIPLFKI